MLDVFSVKNGDIGMRVIGRLFTDKAFRPPNLITGNW